jgi:hypothetical protein
MIGQKKFLESRRIKVATYVLMLKVYEDSEKVIFKFGPNEERMGKVEMNKITKAYNENEPIPGIQSSFYFNCTVSKLLRYLKENEGNEFPDRMFYAS